ncbi:citrate transporter, putative [Bodo saltans]|uniref:Citrate transporter, putative n=1 Tax=Bodo saltans TaxID=75058 RepID=A0A0S4JGA5_BODSA|nr:citrate transporter, putative [Bodo saltans]|eukprot:CUG89143.1 citrate transporter, putative [Bodo saltans]
MMRIEEAIVLTTAMFVCFCVIFPFHFRLSCCRGQFSQLRLSLNFATASVLGVLLLHFIDIVSLQEMASSLWAVGHVQPLAVLVIFFTLAYSSISLDVTGFSRYVALKVLGADDDSQSNGAGPTVSATTQEPSRRLLIEVYLLSGVIALIASNDVVILTLTPVLLHFCDAQHIVPHKVVFIEYVAANTWSAFLLIGNPRTVRRRSQKSTVSKWKTMSMAKLPMSFQLLLLMLLLLQNMALMNPIRSLRFHLARQEDLHDVCQGSFIIPVQESPSNDPPITLADAAGARINGLILGTGVVFLILCGYTPIPMFAVTSITCCVMLACDAFRVRTDDKGSNYVIDEQHLLLRKAGFVTWWKASRVCQVCERMPWAVAPFAASMFILVDALSMQGVTTACSSVLVSVFSSLGSLPATLVTMIVVVVAMNALNNQPATILLSVILLEASTESNDAHHSTTLSTEMSTAAFIALSLGSNIAAVFTPKGAVE